MTINVLVMIVAAYLLGSVSSAILICQIWGLPNPRLHGSKNPGATNVYRIGGKVPAILVLVADVLKGTIPVWSAYFMAIPANWLGIIAVAACLGHIFPVFFQFKGGKGVATALGAIAPIGASLVAALLVTWGLIAYFTSYSSLAAIITALLAPIYTYFIKPAYTVPVSMLTILIVVRHKDNIIRLLKGTEPKIGEKKSANR